MKIYDACGRSRVLIENKFWAGLTDAQPVDYLNMLQDDNDVNSGLLFIVPGQRVEMIWKELKTRCQTAAPLADVRQRLGENKWLTPWQFSPMLPDRKARPADPNGRQTLWPPIGGHSHVWSIDENLLH